MSIENKANNETYKDVLNGLNILIIKERDEKEQKVREYEDQIAKLNEKHAQELSRLKQPNLDEISKLIQTGLDAFKKANELLKKSAENERKPSIPYFNGKGSENIDSWLAEVEKAVENYDEKEKIELAVRHLKDQALQTFDGMNKSNHLTWQEFKKGMQLKHRPANYQAKLRSKLETIKETGGRLDEYANDFRSIITDIENMSEQDKIYRFLSGLDERMRMKLESKVFESLDEAMRCAQEMNRAYVHHGHKNKSEIRDSIDLNHQRMIAERKKNNNNNPRVNPNPNYYNNANGYEKHAGSEHGFQTRAKKIIICFRCKRSGHTAYNCNSRMRKNSD